MKDEKMLEFAAKAAGILFRGYDFHYEDFIAYCEYTYANYQWNPLTNDGDAMRLAVKLNIAIVFDPRFNMVHADPVDTVLDSVSIDYDNDPCAATRKAIVRAAAAIGEKMQ
jgi:hypothetical protein